MDAILSDVHGNLETLTAVLADLECRDIRRVYNLGDTLGYGPNPLECLDLAAGMFVVLKGNFDHAVLTFPDGFCRSAEQSILWTQACLSSESDGPGNRRRDRILSGLIGCYWEDDILYVHGSARNHQNEYVYPEDIHNQPKIEKIGASFDRICFAGHTHVPGIFLERKQGVWEFIYPEECVKGFPVAGCKLICNVGAVGQPRDGDERACYALFDGDRIWFRRVDYDIEATIRKIYAIPELADFLGDRLRDGK